MYSTIILIKGKNKKKKTIPNRKKITMYLDVAVPLKNNDNNNDDDKLGDESFI